MKNKQIDLYAEKKYELSEIKEKLEQKMHQIDADFFSNPEETFNDLKFLHFFGERWYFRTGNYTGLSVLIIEYRGYQRAEITPLGGRDNCFDWGAESDFASHAADALRELGFQQKNG